MQAGVKASGIFITFGGVDVVSDVDLELRPGEIHAVVGENGAGKSSIAKAIAGVYRPRLGTIELDDKPTSFKSPREALASGVALIHQEPLVFRDLSVAENIFAGHQPRRGVVDWRHMYDLAQGLLKQVGLDIDPRRSMAGLSVAQQQRVELASALSHNAKVWIFDETTAPLTPKETGELLDLMRHLADQGCAVMMVTHHLQEVFQASDRITVLRDGKKVFESTTASTDVGEIVRNMVGRELADERFEAGPVGDEVLRVSNLTGPGFKDCSFHVSSGEIVALAGLVGSGRTELARVVFGISRPTSGQIHVSGYPQRIDSTLRAQALGIALVPEDRRHDGLFLDQDLVFNSTIASLGWPWLRFSHLRSKFQQFASRLNLAYQSAEQPVVQLSGGNQQKIVLSKWLMAAPKLLILDEPTRGVDVGAKHEVHKEIRALANQGMAVLMISSDLPEVLRLSDRIFVMQGGKIAAELEGRNATEVDVMQAATGQVPA